MGWDTLTRACCLRRNRYYVKQTAEISYTNHTFCHHYTHTPSSLPWRLTHGVCWFHLALLTPGGSGGGGCLLHPWHDDGVRVRSGGGEGAGQAFNITFVNTRRQFFDLLLAHQRNDLVENLEVRPVRVCCGVAALDVLKGRRRLVMAHEPDNKKIMQLKGERGKWKEKRFIIQVKNNHKLENEEEVHNKLVKKGIIKSQRK